ncbi:MAG: glycosyltransferase family 4 protein [Nanoarchaeota archaeon]|nr:glycosyltransferase family 4 protein [Nanoarchaeota archaeon]
MKIALLTPTFSPFSGIDRLVEIQTKRFLKEGHAVTIYALKSSMKVKGAKIVEIGMPSTSFAERLYRLLMFLDRKKIEKYAKEISRSDMVVSHLYPMNLIAKRAKEMNPKLTYVYNHAGVGITDAYTLLEKAYLRVFNVLNNRSMKTCDEAVSISKFLADELEEETGISSRVEYIPVDAKRFNIKARGERIRKNYKFGKSKVLLYIGRVSPHKGIHLLIEAYKKVKERVPNVKLAIIGKPTFPDYSERLKQMADKGVLFAGFIDDKELPEWYAACDVYTTCSLWEGFDMPITEANACGKPAVAFDVGAHKEVLKTGKLVPEGDTDAFADAVVRLLK